MGRLWLRLDHLVLVVTVAGLDSRHFALDKASELLHVWDDLSDAQRQALEAAGYTRESFENASIRHFDSVNKRRVARQSIQHAARLAA